MCSWYDLTMNTSHLHKQRGFTLLEILLVVALLGILAAIVIVAINPSRQVAQTNNAQRRADVATIINAVYQYGIDNNGDLSALSLPDDVPGDCTADSDHEACVTGGTCTGLVDLSLLTNSGTYLVSIPTDPTGSTTNGAGYHIVLDDTNTDRVTVCAPDAQLSQTIQVTR